MTREQVLAELTTLETLELRSRTEDMAESWMTSAECTMLGPVDLLHVNVSGRR